LASEAKGRGFESRRARQQTSRKATKLRKWTYEGRFTDDPQRPEPHARSRLSRPRARARATGARRIAEIISASSGFTVASGATRTRCTDAAAEIGQEAWATGKTVREICRERKVLDEKTLAEVLDPRRMTRAVKGCSRWEAQRAPGRSSKTAT
jgi:hypothetical protein